MSVTPLRQAVSNAGWYPDPADTSELRFWDGQNWTDWHVPVGENPEPRYGYAADGTVIRMHQYA